MEKVLEEHEWHANTSDDAEDCEHLHTAFNLEATAACFTWVWTSSTSLTLLNYRYLHLVLCHWLLVSTRLLIATWLLVAHWWLTHRWWFDSQLLVAADNQ